MSQYFKVGKIVNTQGLKGEVRVISTTDFAEDRYQKGVELALFRDGEFEKLLTVKSHRRHKNFDLLTFEDHPRIEDVEGYRDSFINNIWFWEKQIQTIYFWLISLSLFFMGAIIFKRLKPHFADVL